jgi:hypothetical protein
MQQYVENVVDFADIILVCMICIHAGAAGWCEAVLQLVQHSLFARWRQLQPHQAAAGQAC